MVDDCYPDATSPRSSPRSTTTAVTLPAQRDQPRHHRQLPAVPRARHRRVDGLPRLRRPDAARLRRHRRAAIASAPDRVDVVQPGVQVVDERRRPRATPRRPGQAPPLRPARRPAHGPGRRGARGLAAARQLDLLALAGASAPRRCAATTSSTASRSCRTSRCWSTCRWRARRCWCCPTRFRLPPPLGERVSATVVDGGRFAGERALLRIAAERCAAHGWAPCRARRSRSTRLPAVRRQPAAGRLTDAVVGGVRTLARHALRAADLAERRVSAQDRSKTASVSWATRSQLNFAACARPSRATPLGDARRVATVASPRRSTRRRAGRTTSRRRRRPRAARAGREAITGRPIDIASSTGQAEALGERRERHAPAPGGAGRPARRPRSTP